MTTTVTKRWRCLLISYVAIALMIMTVQGTTMSGAPAITNTLKAHGTNENETKRNETKRIIYLYEMLKRMEHKKTLLCVCFINSFHITSRQQFVYIP
jgi:hypothetical protein